MIDFSFLRQRGIELVQQLCGDVWTDYNLHDPGVTILEALCYAMTDLSYRTDFPIADILADKEGNIHLEENAFFIREDILSCNPVTVSDFRKYILDKMGQLHNIWLEPVISGFSFGTMHGLYTVRIQVKKEFARHAQDNDWGAALKREVHTCFVSGRNLCEDLIRTSVLLKPVSIRIRAEVIVTGEEPEWLLAAIYRELEVTINPPVKYYTVQELLDKGYRIEDIYTGPLLAKGFIPDEELPPRKTVVDPVELMKVISQVKGVSYVRSLVIVTPDGMEHRLPYILDDNSFAYFENGLYESPIRLMKDKYEIRIRESVFNDIWPRMEEAAQRSSEPVVHAPSWSKVRRGQYRDPGHYDSLQRLFPAVYGIGAEGLSGDESPARKAGARQLKAYLLFFEQLLANYLSQLANIHKLFSIAMPSPGAPASLPQTYYSQPLYPIPDIGALLRAFTASAGLEDGQTWPDFMNDNDNHYLKTLVEGAESDDTWRKRKNALLDHLLARFNERPSAYPVNLYESLYVGPEKETRRDAEIEWKLDLLRHMVESGYNRVRGFDYLSGSLEQKAAGGFHQKMAALLYIRPGNAFLSDAVLQTDGVRVARGVQVDAARDTVVSTGHEKGKPEFMMMAGADTMRQWLEEGRIIPATDREPDSSAHFSNRDMSFFLQGIHPGNYTIGPDMSGGGGWLILFRGRPEHNWQIVGRHPDEPSAIQGLQKLITALRQISIRSEGFHIVEHVLLRPAADTPSFGFRFSATKDEVLLQHAEWISFHERERTLAALLKAVETAPAAGTGMAAWAASNLGNLCRIQLPRHRAYGFMSNPADLQDWEWAEAEPVLENIRTQLLFFKENRLRFYPRFDMLVKVREEGQIREEFFNFNMTIVLPAWPARFQDPNFRIFTMDLFRMHTPAHVKLCFQWLNISRMKEFEHLYRHWTAALQNPDDPEPRKVWSGRIIHFLKKGVY